MKLTLICDPNLPNLPNNVEEIVEEEEKKLPWTTRVSNLLLFPFTTVKKWMIAANPNLQNRSNADLTFTAFILCLAGTVVAVYIFFMLFLIFNGLVSLLPQPPRTVDLKWLPEGASSMFPESPGKIKAQELQNPFYELVQRLAYAGSLPAHLKKDVIELLDSYKEEEDRRDKEIEEAIKAKDEWYQAVYRAEGQRLDQIIEKSKKKKEEWRKNAVANAPSELLQYGGSIPREFGFCLRKIRYFFLRF